MDDDLLPPPEPFRGRVRLFPLPNLVLFPHVLQPLHIFEPRYRDLIGSALEGDQRIAMALLQPGWENDYEGRPPLEPIACLGRIVGHQKLDDGRYNILLHGESRVRLVQELPADRKFREAKAELLDDVYSPATASQRPALQLKLLHVFREVLPKVVEAQQLEQLMGSELTLGPLTDILGYALELPLPLKTRLLAEPDVDRRASLLIAYLAATSDEQPRAVLRTPFPPDFSAN
ncbi:MAG: LON peptidase substrate-binding domain-containing protein [Pirellulales bacterium]|nr:LON peptidase substrate-binding domain-containing protein [Pirellulales bacterium]